MLPWTLNMLRVGLLNHVGLFKHQQDLKTLCRQAIIYVVDSSDTERIGMSAEEFHAILDEEELKDALILVYANKQVASLLQQLVVPCNFLGRSSCCLASSARKEMLATGFLR